MSAAGAVIMAVFAAVWCVLGILASGHAPLVIYGIPVLITGAAIGVASRRRAGRGSFAAGERSRQGRLVGLASGAEGLAILVAVNVLVNIRKPDFIAPAVAMIVGLHFLPLARWLPARLYYATCALLVALGVAGFMIADARQRALVVCLGAACVLWLTSAIVLRQVNRR